MFRNNFSPSVCCCFKLYLLQIQHCSVLLFSLWLICLLVKHICSISIEKKKKLWQTVRIIHNNKILISHQKKRPVLMD